MRPTLESIDPDAVASAVHDLRRVLGRHRTDLDVPPDLPLVRVDSHLFRACLINLLDNAAKYADPGTPIAISAARRVDGIALSMTVARIAPDRDWPAAPILTIGTVEIELSARRVARAGDEVHLTPKEYRILAELARHPGRIVTHAQLLRTVWGPAHEQDSNISASPPAASGASWAAAGPEFNARSMILFYYLHGGFGSATKDAWQVPICSP